MFEQKLSFSAPVMEHKKYWEVFEECYLSDDSNLPPFTDITNSASHTLNTR
jgi:hypothetical protein